MSGVGCCFRGMGRRTLHPGYDVRQTNGRSGDRLREQWTAMAALSFLTGTQAVRARMEIRVWGSS